MRLHRNAPSSFYADDEVVVGAGKARVLHPIDEQDLDASQRVDPAVYYKLLSDAALLAAGSLVEDRFVTTATFNYHVTQSVASGDLHAVAQVVHARADAYTVNTVLTDGEGRVLAMGYGTYNPSTIRFDEPDAGDDAPAEDEEDAIHIYGSFLETPFGYIGLN